VLLKIGSNLNNFFLKCCFDFFKSYRYACRSVLQLEVTSISVLLGCFLSFKKQEKLFKKAVKQGVCLLGSLLVTWNFQLFKYSWFLFLQILSK